MGRALLRRLLTGAVMGSLPLLPVAGLASDRDYDVAVELTDAVDPAVAGVPAPRRVPRWIDPGDGTRLIAESTYANDLGHVAVLLARGTVANIDTHPFFQALGTNGRGCITCHQPQDGMSLSVDTVRWMWRATRGSDPMFAAVDGRDCPHLPAGVPAAHSLMLGRALLRVPMPWPPRDARGAAIRPEFTLEVVRDPTGCNAHPQHGLASSQPTLSVYRRPRPAANLPFAPALMADGRAPDLRAQAADAMLGHLEARAPLTPAQLQEIVDFESAVFVAQSFDTRAGNLASAAAGTAALARSARSDGAAAALAVQTAWQSEAPAATSPARAAARDAIHRGRLLFLERRFDAGMDLPGRQRGSSPPGDTCASCHGSALTGRDLEATWRHTGTTSFASAGEASPALPLFKVTCDARARAHPTLGREFYTQDPGRALVTGRCRDVGALASPQLRGLASHPPYFANGSASDLRAVVEHYDTRYDIGLTEAEKQDLAAFLGAL